MENHISFDFKPKISRKSESEWSNQNSQQIFKKNRFPHPLNKSFTSIFFPEHFELRLFISSLCEVECLIFSSDLIKV